MVVVVFIGINNCVQRTSDGPVIYSHLQLTSSTTVRKSWSTNVDASGPEARSQIASRKALLWFTEFSCHAVLFNDSFVALPYGYSAAELWCEAGGCDDHFYCCFASFGKSIRPKSVALTRRWTRLAELQTNDVLRSFWNVRTIYSIRGREWHCVIDELNRITLEGKLQYFMMAGRLGGNAGAFDHCIVGPRTTVSCKFGHFAESGCQYAVKMLHWCCVWTATAKTTSLVIENILTEHLIWLHLSQVSCIVSQCTNYKVTVAGLVVCSGPCTATLY